MKEFKTIIEEIELLKSRGLNFENEEKAKDILLNNSYYNIINGYKNPFIKNDTSDEYNENTTFEEIYELYNFDKAIKDIFLEYILKVENRLRSLIAYYFPMFHGNDNYLTINSFDNMFNNNQVSEEKKQKRIRDIQSLIGIIHKDIADNLTSKAYIKHYMLEYGFIPPWVLVNILSFGKLSRFLEVMQQKERILISQNFNISDNDLIQYTKLLAYFRNLCAHDDRIYNAKLPKYLYIPDNILHQQLNIPKNNSMYAYGKNDLFALLICLKIMLRKEEFNTLCNKIFGRIKSLEKNLDSIKIDNIINIMNFPSEWRKIKNI